jgi:hypothetical protein
VTPPTWIYFPAAAAPFAPSDLASLRAWYKADAISGLSNNDPVSTWSDSSTSGWNATASSGDRPTYITAAQNSLPIVRFSGSNHLSLGSQALFQNLGGGTIYAVTKVSTTPSNPNFVFSAQNTTNNVVRASIDTGGTLSGGTRRWRSVIRRLDSDSATVVSSTAVVTTSWVLHGSVIDWSGGAATQYIDAVADGTGSPSSGSTSNTATSSVATCIGAVDTNNANGFNGDIAEIVVVHEALSTGDRQKLEGYLAHKWGLTGNLPGASPGPEHPYKNSPP